MGTSDRAPRDITLRTRATPAATDAQAADREPRERVGVDGRHKRDWLGGCGANQMHMRASGEGATRCAGALPVRVRAQRHVLASMLLRLQDALPRQ